MQYKKGDQVVLYCTEEEFINVVGRKRYNNCFNDGIAVIDKVNNDESINLLQNQELGYSLLTKGEALLLKLKEQSTMQENLTEHEKHMADMLVRKMRGLFVESKSKCGDNNWSVQHIDGIFTAIEYRIPQRKIIIPWDLIDDKWVAWAMDVDKRAYFYTSKPEGKNGYWSNLNKADVCQLKIDTTDINWKDSLTLREEK